MPIPTSDYHKIIDWNGDMVAFLIDHQLCWSKRSKNALLMSNQMIQLELLPLPEEKVEEEKKEEISNWTCYCGWNQNKTDELACQICEEPRPDEQIPDQNVEN